MPDTSSMRLNAEKSGQVDTKKIQELLKKCQVRILVGFPSGRAHIEAVHTEENGKRKGGSKVQTNDQGQMIETSELARELHYGSQRTPARPFLEDGVRENKKEIAQALIKEIKKVMSGQSANWDKVGTMAVGKIQEFVRSDYYKTRIPNAQSTIEYKGSDTPLIDGADLINSMNYIVESNK